MIHGPRGRGASSAKTPNADSRTSARRRLQLGRDKRAAAQPKTTFRDCRRPAGSRALQEFLTTWAARRETGRSDSRRAGTRGLPYWTRMETTTALGGMMTESCAAVLVTEPTEFVATNVYVPALAVVTLAMV